MLPYRELGYEIYFYSEDSRDIWEVIISAGEPLRARICGLAAVAMEKAYLSGCEYNEGINPYEAGLGWTVRLNKGDFFGREALAKIKQTGIEKRLIGFEVLNKEVTNTNSVFLLKRSLLLTR
ncbi:MAG: hypothetical protein ACOYKD_09225 [Anaerolineaceae bacterium]|jgi:aminomethyltransferase